MTAANNTPPGKPRKPTKRAASAAALTKAIKDQHESPRTPPQIDPADRRDAEKWPVAAMAAATPQLGTAPGVTIAGSSGSSPHTSCIDLAEVLGCSDWLKGWLQTRPIAEPVVPEDPLAPTPRREAGPVDLPGVTIIEAGDLADLVPARADDVAVRAAAVAVGHALARETRPAPAVEPVAAPSPEPSLGMERRQAHRSRQRGIRGVLKWFSVPRGRRARADTSRPAKETVA